MGSFPFAILQHLKHLKRQQGKQKRDEDFRLPLPEGIGRACGFRKKLFERHCRGGNLAGYLSGKGGESGPARHDARTRVPSWVHSFAVVS